MVHRQAWRHALATGTLAVSWAILAFRFVIPGSYPETATASHFVDRWAHLGGSYGDIILGLFANPALVARAITSEPAPISSDITPSWSFSTEAGATTECKGIPAQPVISFAAYSTPREAYGKIISAFKADWKETHDDQEVIFQESYDGSTLQASRVVGGYEADVVALSLGPDVDEIADAGLITHDWTQETDGGMVTTSVVVFDVRPGNPLGIKDWDDLARPGVEVLTPDPASSGGARSQSQRNWTYPFSPLTLPPLMAPSLTVRPLPGWLPGPGSGVPPP